MGYFESNLAKWPRREPTEEEKKETDREERRRKAKEEAEKLGRSGN